MENYKPNMFQLQCLKVLELQIDGEKGYNEAEIGRKMKVNRSTISRCFKRYREEGFLKDGIYQVAFSIYRQGKDWRSLSMADQGFEKPAYLYLQENQKYLELSVKEMKAMTKGGAMLSGHIQTVKCRSSRDVLMNLPIKNKKIQIPFEDFEFEKLSETEITAQIQLFITWQIPSS